MTTTAYIMIDGELIGTEIQVVESSSALNSFLEETRKTIRELEIEVSYDLFKKWL